MPPESRRPQAEETGATGGETAAQALERARRHGRRAVGEALAAIRALLDAAAIGWSGRPSEAHAALRELAALLDQQSRRFRGGDGDVPAPMMEAILEALDREIDRWERRADSDADARAVLRTFLGLREILWEFGFRRETTPGPPGRATRSRKSRSAPRSEAAGGRPRPGRVQRVDVQG